MRATRLVALMLTCAALAAFLLLRRSRPATRPASQTIDTPASAPPLAIHANGDAVLPLATPSRAADASPPPALSQAALASPQGTVQTALRLLDRGEEDAFRETFLPSVQAQVTAEAFEACRRRVRQAPVRPDWEMAEEVNSGGHRVVRVSMFGKSMTGFHEVNGRWLAESVWCLPTGVP